MKKHYVESEVPAVAAEICTVLTPGTIVLFEGPLGAGKTTVVRAILRQLGVIGEVASPTFGYVTTYALPLFRVHHFDLYRIDTADSFCSMGFEEYLNDTEAVVFIEWSAVIASVLARYTRVVSVRLSYEPDDLTCRALAMTWQEKDGAAKK